MEDLYNEFGYGYFAVEPLKAFLYWTQKFWSAPAPRFVEPLEPVPPFTPMKPARIPRSTRR